MDELKPCPFCGKDVQYNISMEMEPIGVYCKTCHAVIRFTRVKPIQKGENFGDVYKRIAERWNRRAGDSNGHT